MSSTLAKIRKERIKKAEAIRKLGIDPYPAKSIKTDKNVQITKDFKKYDGKKVSVTGRIMSLREHGSLKFANIDDYSGKIQIIIRKDKKLKLNKKKQIIGWCELKLVDVGDFIEVTGKVIKSRTGEISVDADEIRILVKSIRPLPEKRKGIKDKETRFRRRYLEFATNSDSREIFERKAKFWRKARDFMLERGFIEVETPILEHTPGGADARPFITHHNALDQDFYLRISSELFQKRMIGGGFEKVFVLGPNFRNEGIDDEHLQEFYQLEYYWAYSDLNDTIELTKDLYRYLAEEVYGKTEFEYKNFRFDLSKDWEEIDYVDSIKKRFNVDVFKTPLKRIYEIIKKNGVEIEFENNRNRMVDNLWKIIRKDISGPASLLNTPKFISPLAKSYFDKPDITKRFQPIIAGTEMGNAYSELNDPIDQYERFKMQQEMRDLGDDEAQMMDIDFVEMLEYGMPPTSCIGFSERLFWVMEGVTAREGTLFPQTKLHLDETTKEIYGIEKPKKVSTQVKNKFEGRLKEIRGSIIESEMDEISDEKIITIDDKVVTEYENVNVGIAIIKGINVEKDNENQNTLMEKVRRSIESTLPAEDIDDISQIESYFEMYRKMGVDTGSRRSSPEALLRRIVSGKDIYSVNTCVDAYNIAVLLTQVSAGAFDLSKISLPVVLRGAKDGEEIEIIGGEKKKLKDGEICYFDRNGAYNMDFNFRDAERTKVTEKTKDIFVNVEGVNSIKREQVADALKLTVGLIRKYCGGKIEMIGLVKKETASINSGNNRNRLFNEKNEIKAGISRKKALELVNKYSKNKNIVKHMLASEAAMRGYADYFIEKKMLNEKNKKAWELAGLLHDVMFEEDPEGHMYSGADLLRKMGVSEYITHAIEVHGNDDGKDHNTLLDKALIIAESTTGLIVAAALVLPSKKLKDLTVESVLKKFKYKKFAEKISREMISGGCERLRINLKKHIEIVLESMKKISKDLGL